MLKDLKNMVYEANLELDKHGLAPLTFGNTSGMDRDRGLVVIKPSGVLYKDLKPEGMVVVDLSGKVVEGTFNPSSDTPTHLCLYQAWPGICGITHTHSPCATMFAQAITPIPCLGTTHADYFHGEVPVTRPMTKNEVEADYEKNTGAVIVERFTDLDPMKMPAVLVSNHGPFTWGRDATESVLHSRVLEQTACMARGAMQINPNCAPIKKYLLDKHYLRKHGPDAYYGQKK